METFPANEFTEKHDKSFPKKGIDLQFEQLISKEGMSTLSVISTIARLITRIKPLELKEFLTIVDTYIDIRIANQEFEKALYYAYVAFVDCLKDPNNQAKQERKKKILEYIILCAEKMKNNNPEQSKEM